MFLRLLARIYCLITIVALQISDNTFTIFDAFDNELQDSDADLEILPNKLWSIREVGWLHLSSVNVGTGAQWYSSSITESDKASIITTEGDILFNDGLISTQGFNFYAQPQSFINEGTMLFYFFEDHVRAKVLLYSTGGTWINNGRISVKGWNEKGEYNDTFEFLNALGLPCKNDGDICLTDVATRAVDVHGKGCIHLDGNTVLIRESWGQPVLEDQRILFPPGSTATLVTTRNEIIRGFGEGMQVVIDSPSSAEAWAIEIEYDAPFLTIYHPEHFLKLNLGPGYDPSRFEVIKSPFEFPGGDFPPAVVYRGSVPEDAAFDPLCNECPPYSVEHPWKDNSTVCAFCINSEGSTETIQESKIHESAKLVGKPTITSNQTKTSTDKTSFRSSVSTGEEFFSVSTDSNESSSTLGIAYSERTETSTLGTDKSTNNAVKSGNLTIEYTSTSIDFGSATALMSLSSDLSETFTSGTVLMPPKINDSKKSTPLFSHSLSNLSSPTEPVSIEALEYSRSAEITSHIPGYLQQPTSVQVETKTSTEATASKSQNEWLEIPSVENGYSEPIISSSRSTFGTILAANATTSTPILSNVSDDGGFSSVDFVESTAVSLKNMLLSTGSIMEAISEATLSPGKKWNTSSVSTIKQDNSLNTGKKESLALVSAKLETKQEHLSEESNTAQESKVSSVSFSEGCYSCSGNLSYPVTSVIESNTIGSSSNFTPGTDGMSSVATVSSKTLGGTECTGCSEISSGIESGKQSTPSLAATSNVVKFSNLTTSNEGGQTDSFNTSESPERSRMDATSSTSDSVTVVGISSSSYSDETIRESLSSHRLINASDSEVSRKAHKTTASEDLLDGQPKGSSTTEVTGVVAMAETSSTASDAVVSVNSTSMWENKTDLGVGVHSGSEIQDSASTRAELISTNKESETFTFFVNSSLPQSSMMCESCGSQAGLWTMSIAVPAPASSQTDRSMLKGVDKTMPSGVGQLPVGTSSAGNITSSSEGSIRSASPASVSNVDNFSISLSPSYTSYVGLIDSVESKSAGDFIQSAVDSHTVSPVVAANSSHSGSTHPATQSIFDHGAHFDAPIPTVIEVPTGGSVIRFLSHKMLAFAFVSLMLQL
ncbi:hypothetical protein DICA3_F28964 [Diutina catenulata]